MHFQKQLKTYDKMVNKVFGTIKHLLDDVSMNYPQKVKSKSRTEKNIALNIHQPLGKLDSYKQ